jgi:hypothetical protein
LKHERAVFVFALPALLSANLLYIPPTATNDNKVLIQSPALSACRLVFLRNPNLLPTRLLELVGRGEQLGKDEGREPPIGPVRAVAVERIDVGVHSFGG